MDATVLQLLQNSGFAEKEAAVYHALLELGQGDITDIAHISGLKRSNIYVVLEKLESQGYVSIVPNQTIKTFTPAEPTKILHQLQNTTQHFKEMLPFINAMYTRPGKKPRIQYFEGKQGVLSVYREVNRFPKVYFISSIERLQKYIPEEVELWIKHNNTSAVAFEAKHIIPRTSADLAFAKALASKKNEFRLLPKDQEIDMDFTLYGNKVAITSIGDPFFVVVIESSLLFNSLKVIFDIVWNQAKPFDYKKQS